jgi:drug/metabolite transporter (DMT)-like permease
MRLPWYVSALFAAAIWGLHYPLLEHALKKISLVSVLFLTALPFALLGAVYHRRIAADFAVWRDLDGASQIMIGAIALTGFAATVLLYMAIGSRNATLASLIEISYPAFVALFAYVLFRETALNMGVLIGAALIFAGVAVIVLNNR